MTQTAAEYWQPARHYPPVPTPRRRYGAGGLLTSLAGVTAVAVSFTALPWFTGDSVHVGPDHSAMYFSWLGWALLVGVGFAAVLANLPTGASWRASTNSS